MPLFTVTLRQRQVRDAEIVVEAPDIERVHQAMDQEELLPHAAWSEWQDDDAENDVDRGRNKGNKAPVVVLQPLSDDDDEEGEEDAK